MKVKSNALAVIFVTLTGCAPLDDPEIAGLFLQEGAVRSQEELEPIYFPQCRPLGEGQNIDVSICTSQGMPYKVCPQGVNLSREYPGEEVMCHWLDLDKDGIVDSDQGEENLLCCIGQPK